MVNEYYALLKLPVLSSQQFYVLLRVYNVTKGIRMVQMGSAINCEKRDGVSMRVCFIFESMIRLSKQKKNEPALVKKHSRSIAAIVHILNMRIYMLGDIM